LKSEKGQASRPDELSELDPPYKGPKMQHGHHKTFVFHMEAGKTYQIDMKSTAFDSYLYLEDPDGSALVEDDDSGGKRDARIIHKATKTGKHRIIATELGNKSGEFTLTVRRTDVKTGAEKDDGFVRLSGGKDLSAWQPHKDWRVQDGVITAAVAVPTA